MTERGQVPDGARACPFVALEDDRDARLARPDHRHRCFAEPRPAPRALAHQEAYCLSPSFPGCPVFQDWARREAARVAPDRGGRDERRPADSDAAAAAAGLAAGAGAGAPGDLHPQFEPGAADPWAAGEDEEGSDFRGDIPARRPQRRDWASPPPWSGAGDRRPGGPASEEASRASRGEADEQAEPPAFLAGRGPAPERPDDVRSDRAAGAGAADAAAVAGAAGAGRGLADSMAGRVSGADLEARAARQVREPEWQPEDAEAVDDEDDLAERGSEAAARRRSIAAGRFREPRDPAPPWERPRREEEYPTLRRPVSVSMPQLTPIMGGIAALVIAALVLFFVPPILLNLTKTGGGGPGPAASASAPAGASTQPSVAPSASAGPTQQVYVVKSGDTVSKIAKRFGVTIEELMAANPNLKNPDKIAIGDQLVIPVPQPSDVTGASASP